MRPYPFAEYHTCVLRLTLNTVYLNYPPRIRTLALTLTLTRTLTLGSTAVVRGPLQQ